MASLVGQTLGRYEIVESLGAGGMGEVYKARDTELGRWVAIKVISSKVAQSRRAVDRFEREAKTVAQLSHPNILDIHDFGRDGGIVYAVTELLEGNDLRDRMRGSMLPLSKALEIGIAVANGLAAAHSKGIIHRDIKPDNIFVTSTGRVKILDFGIAGLKAGAVPEVVDADARTESLTMTGDVLGTVGYMSPEQIRGEKVDQRSDIFALGCLLYEVLTGRRAFRGETSNDTILAILNRDPEPIAEHRPDIPAGLEAVVRRCLEKQPDERFESARDVAFALQALSEGRSTPQEIIKEPVWTARRRIRWGAVVLITLLTIAAGVVGWERLALTPLPENLRLVVLPFEVNGDDEELALIAAGLTETITEDLALFEELEDGIDWVVPRHALADTSDQTLADTHRKFNNTIAISGRLQRDGSNVRLTLEAIDPADETRLRGSRIEAVPGNVHSFQQTPVLRIAEQLGIAIDSDAMDRLAGSSTTMMGAFDAYVRARGLLATTDDEQDVEAAISLLTEAVQQDPLFTSGHVALGRACIAGFETTNDDRWIERGLEHAHRASQLDGRADEAWRIIGALHRAAGRPGDALAAFEVAVNLQPNNATACTERGLVHQDLNQYDDAEKALERALYLRPGYWPGNDALAKLYLVQGRYEAAAIQFRHVIECAPDFALGYVKLAAPNTYLGRADAAAELLEKSIRIEPSFSAYSNLGTLYFEASRFGDAAAMYELALEMDSDNYVLWGFLAYAYMFGDQSNLAEGTFRRAVELAEAQHSVTPDDLWLCTDLADYYAMLGERVRGLRLLETVVAASPSDPQLIAWIAEAFEDLDDRARALDWVDRSFAAGVDPNKFEDRPTLRDLVADERYRALVEKHIGAS